MLYARCKDRTNPRVHQKPYLPKAAGGPRLVLLLLLLLKLNLLSVPSDSYTPEILLPPISAHLLAHGNPVPHLFTFGQIFFSSGPQQQKCWRDEKDVLPAAGAQNLDATKCWNRQLQLAHCFMNMLHLPAWCSEPWAPVTWKEQKSLSLTPGHHLYWLLRPGFRELHFQLKH